jgi:hypothetical protein
MATREFYSISVNQNRNTLMQEFDRFDGMVIVSTNLFQNYAPVLLCRSQRPNYVRLDKASMHGEFLFNRFPTPWRAKVDNAVLATLSRGLSGGDILKICVNAIRAGSGDADLAKWVVTQGMIEREISKVKKAKAGPKRGGLGFSRGDRRGIAFEGLGRVGSRRVAGTGCEGVCPSIRQAGHGLSLNRTIRSTNSASCNGTPDEQPLVGSTSCR